MWNIMKAQNYQLKRDNLLYYLLAAGLAALLLPFFFQDAQVPAELTAGSYLVQMGELFPFFFVVISLLLTCRICGWDYNDKTINYEILSGHARGEIYWGRALVSLLWSAGTCAGFSLLPVLLLTALNGWGVSMDMGNVMRRYALMLFPILRLVCEFVLLTFLLQNCYVAMIIGWVLYETTAIVLMIAEETAEVRLTSQFAYTNMNRLFDFTHGKLDYVNGKDVIVYSTAIDAPMVLGTIGTSLLVSAICLLAGYLVYKRSDQN
ncbi:MAG: ABC transporter permease [Lachnospiraceae bacterium]|nr:ABC transporter permease [Lachnospiraceae bacterium]